MSFILSRGTWSRCMKKMVFVPLFCPGIPWARHPISFPYEFAQTAFVLGLPIRCLNSRCSPFLREQSWPFRRATSSGFCEMMIVLLLFRRLVSWFWCNLAFGGLGTPRMLAWRCQHTQTLLLERCSLCVSACCILVGGRHLPPRPVRCNWVGPRRTTLRETAW